MLYSDCSPIRLSAHSAASEDPTSRPSVCALDHCIFNIEFRCIKKQIGSFAHSITFVAEVMFMFVAAAEHFSFTQTRMQRQVHRQARALIPNIVEGADQAKAIAI